MMRGEIMITSDGNMFICDKIITGIVRCIIGSDTRFLKGIGGELYYYKIDSVRRANKGEIENYLKIKSLSKKSFIMEKELKKLSNYNL